MARRFGLGRQPWLVYLILGLLATGAYFALPSTAAQNVAYDLLGLSAVVAIIVGVRHHRPASRAPWYLLALGDGLAVAGDLIWTIDENLRGVQTPFPSLADVLYLAGYVVFFAGVLLLVRNYAGRQDRAGLIDATILATGAGVLVWTFLIDPKWDDTTLPVLNRLVAGAYPAVDILTLTAVLCLIFGPAWRSVPLRLLILALGCSFVTDIAYAILLAQGQYQTGQPIDAGWLLSYVLHGAIALHPAMRARPAPAEPRAELPFSRLILLAITALIGPALLALQAVRGTHLDMPVIIGASVVLFLLALGRLQFLAGTLRRREARFRALVQHAGDGIAIVDRAGTTLYQSPSSAAIVGFAPEKLLGADIFARVHPDDLDRAHQLFAALVTNPGAIDACDLRVQHADGSWRDVEVRATNLLAEPSVGGLVLNYRDISERVRAETALRASEERLRAQYQGFPVPTLTWQRQGDDFVLLDYNDAARAFSQGTIANLHGITCRALNHDRPDIIADFERCYHERTSLRREVHHPAHPSGEAKQLVATYVYVSPDLVMAHIEDVTARTAAEEMRARLAAIVESSGDAIFGSSAEGIITSWNAAAEHLYGYTAAEALGQPDALIVPPERAENREPILAQLARGERVVQLETERTAKDGRRLSVAVTISPITDNQGRLVGTAAITRDIGERLRAEAALRRSEERLRAVVDSAFDAVVTADAEGHIQSFNRGAERIFGYAAAEVVGQPLTILMPQQLHTAHAAGVQRYRATGKPVVLGRTSELVGRRKDGTEFPLEAALTEGREGGEVFFTGILRDVSERRAYEAQLRRQAMHDTLTGLPNRALLLDRLDHALARARRGGPGGAVLFLDLDRFKDVNDSLGHAAGDRLLVAVASRLRAKLRDEDTLARLGGDEFTVLLEDVADPGEAARAAGRLASALDLPIALEGQEYRVTTSIGVVLAGADYARAEDVLRDADVAMYRAKESGKARYAVFDPAMQAEVLARLALERDLRLALERDEFVLHYQPIVSLHGGQIVEAEALVRWRHPERGLVPPGDFITLAEETGLIRPLGRWVLREACGQAAAWARAGHPLTVAVNLTSQEFQQPGLAGEVATILTETGLDPCWLRLEITESLAMRDTKATIATLTALRALGVGTAIDDFGTGYSSLAVLKSLPVDVLKVDRAFVATLEIDPEDAAIVAAVVTLAHTLGGRVVAEGVETAGQAARLRDLGCDLAQGYHFARPQPAGELAAHLAGIMALDEMPASATRRELVTL